MGLGGLHLGKTARHALALTFAIWLVFVYGSYVVSSLIAGHTAFLFDVPLDLPAVILVALVAQSLYPVVRRTAGMRPMARWLALIAATAAVALVQAAINVAENTLLGELPRLDAAHLALIRDRFGRTFLIHAYLSFSNATLLVFLVEAQRGASARVRLAETEAQVARARATALRLQLNPHFLFNALNSVSSLLVTRRVDDAEEMLGRLAEFLRLSLDADPHALVPLEEEFGAVESYLEIEAVRFGERMVVELDCPRELLGTPVPSFILQPLVENAVKYGVARSPGQVCVRIEAALAGDELRLLVSDTGCGRDRDGAAAGFGIGLANVRERLASRYGAGGTLTTEDHGDGFTATVRVPLGLGEAARAA